MFVVPESLLLARRSLAIVLATVAAIVVPLALPGSAGAAGIAVALEFTVQPTSGPELAPLSPQPAVRIVDADGGTVTSSHLAVTLGLSGTGGVLSCNALPLQAFHGVATFSGCQVNGLGTFRLRASAHGLRAVLSDPFTVGPPGPVPAAQLRVDVGSPSAGTPFTATAGGPLWFPLRFLVVDSMDRTITTGPASTTAVTIAMAPNWEEASIACPGGLTEEAVAGVATFTDCSISQPGEDLRIVASAEGLEPAWSLPIDVWPSGSPEGPNLGPLGASTRGVLGDVNSVITWGDAIAFYVQMHPLATGQDVAGRLVSFETTDDPYDPETWRTIGTGTTDATGTAWFRGYRPHDNRYYRAAFAGASDLGPAIALVGQRVVVRQKVVLVPTTRGSTAGIARGATIRFRATVRPARADLQPGTAEWQVWHTVDGHVTVSDSKVVPDASGNAYLTVRFTSGVWKVQARALPTLANANSTWVGDRYRVP